MSEKTPLLILGNAPYTPTGYGQQINLFAPLLNEHYEVGIVCNWGLIGARLTWKGIPLYPGVENDFGSKALPSAISAHFQGREGILLTLLDTWTLDPDLIAGLDAVCWTPVDHDPLTDRLRAFFQRSGAIPLAMSEFGQRQMREFDSLYCPHGVDTEVFQPIDRRKAREVTKMPQDAFIVGMVAANKGNPSRKCFAEALLAFKKFHMIQPDAKLYLHTEMSGMFQGVDMGALIKGAGLPDGCVYFADQRRLVFDPLPPEAMAHFYSSFDVLLSPSAGEGFGVSIAEAQSCGTPAIVTDFTAMREVCGSGWKVEHHPFWTHQDSWMALPDVDDIVDALKDAYRSSDRERNAMAGAARNHALKYDVNAVMDQHMLPALKLAEERFAARKPQKLKAAA